MMATFWTDRGRAFWLICALALILAMVAGCAQNTESGQQIASDQQQVTPTTTKQDQATQGSEVYIYNTVNYYPDSTAGGGPDAMGPPYSMAPDALTLEDAQASPGDGTLKNSKAGYVLAGLSFGPITVTTGGTTPSVTGTTTGSAAQTQTPSGTQTTSPVQDIKPEISLSLNAAFAPGGMIDQLAAAVGKGSLSDLTKENQQDLRAAYARGLESGQWGEFWKLAGGMLGIEPPATTQPGGGTDGAGG